MGREIKFRVWDNEENKYFVPQYEAYKGVLLDLSICLGGDLMRRTLELPAEHVSCFPDRYLVEQFTGFKDSGNTEFYEDDIFEDDGDFYHVMFDVDSGSWEAINITDGSNIGLCEFASSLTCWIQGNVHENPELLK